MAEATGAANANNNNALIKYGIHQIPGNFAGKTVAQVRQEYGHLLNMNEDTKAMKGKTVMDENYVIEPNDTITFIKAMGEKGV